jgi:hypothetical protein
MIEVDTIVFGSLCVASAIVSYYYRENFKYFSEEISRFEYIKNEVEYLFM